MRILWSGLLLLFASRLSLQLEINTSQVHFLARDATCSVSQPCPEGCCSSAGHCGYGPEYCGKGCQNNCERKSDCNPGWDDDKWSKWKKCPLNVCCSKHGFCGTTDEFCDEDDEVDRPSCSSPTPVKRVIGYFEAWSTTERGCYNMLPEEIPFGYYTHINFAFATIDPKTFELIPGDGKTESYMRRIQSLRNLQPDLKIWIAVGGWTFNDPGPTATTFSDIAASPRAQEAFITSLIKIMNTYGFDGLDLDWEYPVAPDRNGRGEDFDNFVTFMARLRKRLNDKGMSKKGISITLPSSYWYLQHFNIKGLQRYIDWFNIMSYDIHGSWDIDNDWTGPWVNSHTNLTEIQMAMDLLWRNDIDPDKVVMGMSFYSRSFTLADSQCSKPGCRVVSGGNAGKCSHTTGVLLHAEIQDIIKEHKLTPTLYRDAAYKAVSWGDQWVSFDDVATWRLKSNLFRNQCVSGIMVWAASQDDKQGTNIKALVSSIGRRVMDPPEFKERPVQADPVVQELPKMCTWAACGQDCPSGFKLMSRASTGAIFGETCSVGGTTKFCCPADQELPTCEWRGHRNSGRCKPGCNVGEVEVGGIMVGCKSGYQAACCTMTKSTETFGRCSWTTGSCELGEVQQCPSSQPNRVAGASWAWGGVWPCGLGPTERSYCCTNPMPEDFKKCHWITEVEDRKGTYCDACRDDQVQVAARSTDICLTPTEALCCDRPKLQKRDEDEPAYDPFGSQKAKELRNYIEAFLDDPTCPAEELDIKVHDAFGKRSLEKEEVKRKAANCHMNDWEGLMGYAVLLTLIRSAYIRDLEIEWDSRLARALAPEYEVGSLRQLNDDMPWRDPLATAETLLYDTAVGVHEVQLANDIPSILCQDTPSGSILRRRDEGELSPRRIFAWASGRNTNEHNIPWLVTILDGIAGGSLTLHYARWSWYEAIEGRGEPGPFLELAYWIGPNIGVVPHEEEFDQYRDTTSGRGQDRWVVFHIHFPGGEDSFLHQTGGQIYMGASYVSFFHSNTIRPGGRGADWQVGSGNTRGQSARDGFDCRYARNGGNNEQLWWIGRPITPTGTTERRRWVQAIDRWGQSLLNQGYVARRAWGLILPFAEVDEDTGIVERGRYNGPDWQSPQLGRGYVWYTNWLADPDGEFGVRRYTTGPPF